jgi:tRNA-intron endonuclease
MPFEINLIGKIAQSNSQEAYNLNEKSSFGEPVSDKIQYTLYEAFYLLEKSKVNIISGKKTLSKNEVHKKFQSIDRKFSIKYPIFKDLREKGYIVKTALKFGADFRVYEKGIRPGDNHAKWIVFAEHESQKLNWNEFSAKNRVAHSTNKNLLLGILDEEGDITYYEVKWVRP